MIEEGESGEAAVLRELEEETGKRAGRAEFLCELYPSVGFCTEKIQLFFATELTAGTQKLDADEFVEIEKYTLEEAIAMIHKGEIKDGKTIAALFCMAGKKKRIIKTDEPYLVSGGMAMKRQKRRTDKQLQRIIGIVCLSFYWGRQAARFWRIFCRRGSRGSFLHFCSRRWQMETKSALRQFSGNI